MLKTITNTPRYIQRANTLCKMIAFMLLFFLGNAVKASAQVPPTITLTSQEVMWVDANKCNAEGPRGAWLSYVVTNPNATAITNVTVTFAGFTGTYASYFVAPHDLVRTFTSIPAGQSVPVYYYVDYSDVCNHPGGGGNPYTGFTANYTLTVNSSAGTAVRNGTISTKELLTASAAGQAISSPLSTSGIYVGQIFTQTVTYTFGNNSDLFFQPNGEKDFPDLCLRLIKDSISATTGSVTGILGQTNALAFPSANTAATDNTITVVYTWQVLCTNTYVTLHPWAAAKSGTKYKYTGFGATSAVIDAVQAITINKTVNPSSLPTPTSDGGYGSGIVQWNVQLSNSSSAEILVNRINDIIPSCMTLSNVATASSQINATNSYQMPSVGSTGSATWIGAVPVNSSQWQYKVPAGGSLNLTYRTNVSGCTNLNDYTNSATASVGTTTVGPSTATVCFPPIISYGSGVFCPNGTASVTLSGRSGGTYSSSSGLSLNSSTGAINLSTSTPGVYTISYTVGGTNCPTASRMITINPLPASIAGGDFVCLSRTATFTSATTGGTWSSSNTSVASINASTGVVTGNALGSATITYTLGTGCYVTKTVTVSSNPAAITGSVSICGGSTATLSNTTSGGVWGSSNASVATVGSTGVVTGVSTGTTTISYILPTGCFSTAVATVNTTPSPISGSASVCVGYTTTLGNGVSGGTWTSGNTSKATVNATSGVVTGVAAGTATISYTLSTGCSVSVVVTVVSAPAAITGANSVCAGLTTAYTNSVSGGIWSTSSSSVATIGSTSGLLTAVAAGSVNVTYTIGGGCYVVKSITVNQGASAILGSGSVCAGSTITLTASGAGTWSSSSSVATVGTTGIVTGISEGSATITYTVSGGCYSTRSISVNAVPVIVASGATSICPGESALLSAGGASTYSWTPSGSLNCSTCSSVIATPTLSTTYTVTGTGANGCISTATVTVTLKFQPVVSVSSNVTICQGDNTVLTAAGATTYAWSPNTGLSCSTCASVTANPLTTTVYTVVGTASSGCSDDAVVTVSVNPVPAVISGISSFCIGQTSTLSNATSGGTWSSSNSAIAGVGSTSGMVTAVAAGSAVVTYTLGTGCYSLLVVTVNPSMVLTSSVTNVSCFGGSTGAIDLTVSGGTSPFTYSWSNSATTQDLAGVTAGTYSVTVTDASGCSSSLSRTVTQPTVLATSATSSNVSCAGGSNGSIDLTATDGTTPYIYSWSNGATSQDLSGLAAGTYSVTVTDVRGCTATLSRTIAQPTTLTASATSVNVSCNGGANGSIDVTVAGGTTPYTYLWNGGATTQDRTGLTAGTYSVTVTDANGCTATVSRTITQPATLVATATSTNVNCNGGANGTIDLTVTGGTTAYTYSWSNGATTQDLTGLSAGTYSVTVTDANGCTATVTRTITQPSTLTATTSSTNALCYGCANGTASVTAAGGTTAYTYLWSNGATTASVTGLVAGTYTVTVTDANGCTVVKTVTITQPAALVSTITNTNVNCNGGTNGTAAMTVTGGTAPYTYLWSNGATTASVTGLAAVTYSVVATDANGYTTTQSVMISQPAILAVIGAVNDVPCHGTSTGSIDVTMSGGTSPYSYSWSNGATTQDALGLSIGSYTVNVTDANGCAASASYSLTEPTPISLSATTNHIICGCAHCHGMGEIYLTVAGGVGSYTYLWSNGATSQNNTGLMTGTYTVVVTDANGCTASGAYSVVSPVYMSVASVVNDVTCNGGSNGSIALTVSGGIAPFTYSWSNGDTTSSISGLVSGVYSVSVTDALGCSKPYIFVVEEPATFDVTAMITNVACFGTSTGGVNITPSGGTAPYTYSWSNGATSQDISSVPAGSYTVTITDAHACSYTYDYPVSSDPATEVTITAPSIVCVGSAINFVGAPAGGTWSSSNPTRASVSAAGIVTGLAVGTTRITYTRPSGCFDTMTISINPAIANISGTTNVCVGETITLTHPVSGGTWLSANTSIASVNPSTGIVTGVTAGTVNITYYSSEGCYKVVNIWVKGLPVAFTGNTVVCEGNMGQLYSTAGTAGTWSSSNTSIATVGSGNGAMYGVSAGTATITFRATATQCAVTGTITVNSTPASITGPSAVCVGSTVTLASATPGGVWSSGNVSAATVNISSGLVTGISAGVANISYTLPSGCRRVRAVTVNQLPAAISGTVVICIGTSTTLSTATPGCSWSSGNTSVATITSGGVMTGVGVGTAVITYTSGAGCFRTTTVTVNPSLPANTGVTTVCVGQTTALANAATGGTWSSGNAAIATVNSSTGVVSGITAGVVNITYRVATCFSVSSVTVISNSAAISGATSICAGTTTSLTHPVSGGTWTSSNTARATVDAGTGVVTGVSAGTVVITYSLTSSCYKTVVVTVNTLTTAITGTTTVCSGNSTTLTNATSGGTWSSGNTSLATVGLTTGVVTGVSAGSAVITYRTAGGCYTTAIVNINETPAAITGTTYVCAGQTTALYNTTVGGTWTSSNTSVATVNSVGLVTGINAGAAMIYYSLSGSCGVSVTVSVGAMPASITGGGSAICAGSAISLSSTTGGGTWTSNNATVASIGLTSGNVTGVSAGTAVITYTLSSGCYRTTVVTVTPLPEVAPISVSAPAFCVGTPSYVSSATTGGVWTSGNTAVVTVSTSGTLTGIATGTAIISYGVTGTCGTSFATTTVTVNSVPNPGVISGTASVCIGSVIALHASVTGGVWISGNPEIATTCPCNSGQVTGIAAGVAIMSYAVTNDCGTTYATYPVTVNPVPSVTPGIVTPGFVGATSVSLPFTTTGTPSTYTIVWGPVASSAGFVDISASTLGSSPMSVAVPSSATENTYYGTISVSNGLCSSPAQPFSVTLNTSVNIYTYAGIGTNGYTGNSYAATAAKMSHPYNIATDCNGNTFIADFENAVIRKVSATGVITTVAGNGTIGYSGDGGPATNATMSHPSGIVLDAAGNLYFTDFNNHVVRRVSTSGIITRVAGNLANGYAGDGGAATSARLYYPSGLTIDGAGNLFIADNANNVVRKVTPDGVISTVAGTNIPGYTGDGGVATAARLNSPKNVHADGTGNLYISDWGNQVVRKVDAAGIITTIAGNGITGYSGDGGPATAAKLDHPYGITTDGAGNVYFSEYTNHIVRKVNPAGIISTIAGDHTIGYSGDYGPALLAQLYQPMGLSRDCAGRIFIADNANYVVRILGEYNRTPFFTAGDNQNIDVCYGSGPISMNTRLAVIDFDTTQPLTWSVVSAPAHGTLVAGYTSTSTGAAITPSGLSYTPATGYAGADVFVVRISDGIASSVTTVNVTVSMPPVAGTITGTTTICGSGITHLITTGTGGVWTSSNTSVAVVDSFGYVSGVGYGTSTISNAVTNACGISVATKVVTFNPMPYAGSIIGAAKVCRGTSIPYMSPVSGGVWSSGNTSIATVNSAGMVYGVDTGMTTITYTVTNSCGTAYGLRDVTVEILPIASPITGPTSVCAGATIQLFSATPAGAWYSSNESIATVHIDSGYVTGVSAGVVTISYRHNTTCGIVMVTRTFTVNPSSVTIPAIGGASTVCVGGTTTLTNGLTGGTWSSSSYPVKLTINSTTGVVTGVTAGTAVVTYTVPHECGVSYITRVMTVNPLPTVSPISGTMSICVGWTITATNATSGGVWSSSNPSSATVSSAGVITGVAGGMPVISYSVTNGCGTIAATALVPVGTAPAVTSITGASSVCVEGTAALYNSTTGGSWSTSDITHAAVSSAGIVTGVGEGTATITYAVHNGCGYSFATKLMTVNPLPEVATVTGSSLVNVGGTISLACASTGGVWSSSNTALATVNAAGVVTGVSHGTATISYTVSNVCGSVSGTKVVNVVTLYATIYGSHVSSPGGADGCALLTVVGGVAPYTFLWSNGATTQNLFGLSAGTYSVLVTDALGDTTSASVVITELGARGVASGDGEGARVSFGAHPNPFTTRSVIRFNLPEGKFATVYVFNAATGMKVSTVFNDHINAGEEYTATLEGADIPAGIYVYRISTENKSYIGKVLLVK